MLTVELKDSTVSETKVSETAGAEGDKSPTSPTTDVENQTNLDKLEEDIAAVNLSGMPVGETLAVFETGSRIRNESSTSDGLEHVSTKDLFKKRSTVCEDDDFVLPVDLLPGETLLYQGRTLTQHFILLTTFRLFVTRARSFLNIPLCLIDSVDSTDTAKISILCKDGATHCCVLANSETCFKWLSKIKQEVAAPDTFTDIFAACFFSAVCNLDDTDEMSHWKEGASSKYSLNSEIKRLGFKQDWKISNINDKFRCCDTYPKENLVPKGFDEDVLEKAAKFRTRFRFPSAVWRNRENGCVLVRSSQPIVGVFCQRSTEDENLLQAIMDACNSSTDMVIADCRSYTAAVANRAKGGGCEYPEYYSNCTVEFMGLANIHCVRNSFSSLRSLLTTGAAADAGWYTQLEATNWITYLSLLLKSACFVADTLAHKPVLVHCSDGWDRTPQIVSLAQLILDPYYRTFKGFQVLIEKEWLLFGHKFADRCGHTIGGADSHENSPVFLQWLDAVYQLTRQFPTAFEFGESYLRKLMQHVYSCLFGTFLCNNEKEREELLIKENTISIWSYIEENKSQLSNSLYSPKAHKVLNVSWRVRDIELWTSVYAPPLSECEEQTAAQVRPGGDEPSSLARSQSDPDLTSIAECSSQTAGNVRSSRRLSDPDLSSSASFNLNESGSSLNQDGAIAAGPNSSINNMQLTGSDILSDSPVFVPSQLRDRNTSDSGTTLNKRGTEKEGHFPYRSFIDQDGLTQYRDPTQQKIKEIEAFYKRKIEKLEKRVLELNSRSSADASSKCQCVLLSPDEIDTLPGSAEIGSDKSDSSWEEVTHKDTGLTLWIPDHAVSSCSACQLPFRVFRRKHHCRQCGQVFCQSCASAYVPIPDQQLFDPVRVCRSCHVALSSLPTGGGDEEDAVDLLEQAVNSDEHAESSPEHAAIVCSSSPREIPRCRVTGDKSHFTISDTAATSPVTPPALLSVTRPEHVSSKGSSSGLCDLTYKTCSLESVNNDNSGTIDKQLVVGPRAKC